MFLPSRTPCVPELRTIVGMKFLAAASKADSLQWPPTPRGPHISNSHHDPPSPAIREEGCDTANGALPSGSNEPMVPEAPPPYSSVSNTPPPLPLPTPPPTKQPASIPTPLPVKESPRVVLGEEAGGKPPMLPPRSARKKGKNNQGDEQSRPSQPPGITSLSPAQSARRGSTPVMGNSPPREVPSAVNAAAAR